MGREEGEEVGGPGAGVGQLRVVGCGLDEGLERVGGGWVWRGEEQGVREGDGVGGEGGRKEDGLARQAATAPTSRLTLGLASVRPGGSGGPCCCCCCSGCCSCFSCRLLLAGSAASALAGGWGVPELVLAAEAVAGGPAGAGAGGGVAAAGVDSAAAAGAGVGCCSSGAGVAEAEAAARAGSGAAGGSTAAGVSAGGASAGGASEGGASAAGEAVSAAVSCAGWWLSAIWASAIAAAGGERDGEGERERLGERVQDGPTQPACPPSGLSAPPPPGLARLPTVFAAVLTRAPAAQSPPSDRHPPDLPSCSPQPHLYSSPSCLPPSRRAPRAASCSPTPEVSVRPSRGALPWRALARPDSSPLCPNTLSRHLVHPRLAHRRGLHRRLLHGRRRTGRGPFPFSLSTLSPWSAAAAAGCSRASNGRPRDGGDGFFVHALLGRLELAVVASTSARDRGRES